MNPVHSPEVRKGFWAAFGKMSPAQRDRWAKTRLLGKSKYILSRGVCWFGGLMYLIFSLFPACTDYLQRHTLDSDLWFRLIAGAIICPLVGYFYGRKVWAENERRFVASH